MPDFIPRKEADLVGWSSNLSQKINLAPADYALTPEQTEAFAVLQQSFATLYEQAISPATRSVSNVFMKDEARAAMVANARVLARIVRASPAVSSELKFSLGLTVKLTGPTRSQPPAVAPNVQITGVTEGTLHVELKDAVSANRTRMPAGVSGAAIFYFIGEDFPAAASDWTFATNVTRSRFDLTIPVTTPRGSRVWVMAYWLSPRAERSPASLPRMTHIGSTGIRLAA